MRKYVNTMPPQLPFYVICDNIRSLENIGSIFRTADALKVDKIFLCGICGLPSPSFQRNNSGRKNTQKLGLGEPNSKISKTALGAEKWIDWEHHWQTWRIVEKLKKEKVLVVALEQAKKSINYTEFKPKFPLALVVGNEIKGVSPSVLKRADAVISLPMLGKKESLNVAVAFGIAGYEINKKRFRL